MKRLLLLIVLITGCSVWSRPPSAGAVDEETAHIDGVLAREPDNTVYLYIKATQYDALKDAPNTILTLQRLEALQWNLGVNTVSFPNSADNADFKEIAAKLEAREREVLRATPAFTMPSTVRSEGITYDPVDDVFYFSGGADKLLRVDRNGTMTDFPIEPFGTAGRLGMDVDAQRRHIWTVSASFREPGASALSVYDLRNGQLLRRVSIGDAKAPATFNDMTLLQDGTAFVTDTNRHHVYRLAPNASQFELLVDDLLWPNGITTSADEQTLYVADFRGINAIDLRTNARRVLATDTPINGIDGLVAFEGTLIGIHNVLGRPRVVRVRPGDPHVELLESKNPRVTSPATGVIAGRDYYFLANLREKDAERRILKIAL
jgi:sugar lactone lactonase YvrE